MDTERPAKVSTPIAVSRVIAHKTYVANRSARPPARSQRSLLLSVATPVTRLRMLRAKLSSTHPSFLRTFSPPCRAPAVSRSGFYTILLLRALDLNSARAWRLVMTEFLGVTFVGIAIGRISSSSAYKRFLSNSHTGCGA